MPVSQSLLSLGWGDWYWMPVRLGDVNTQRMTTPASGFVTCARDGGIATVTLVNAKSMNILGGDAIEELTTAFRDLSREDDRAPGGAR